MANAILDLSEFLRRNPTRADAFAQRGWLRRATGGDPDAAFSDFQDALRLDPRSASSLLGRALCWHDKEEFAKAEADCAAALAIEPQNVRAMITRAEARLKLGRRDEALADMEAVCRANPTDPTVFCSRATIYNGLGEYALAIDDCQTALKLDARQLGAWMVLCSARLQNGDYARCIEDCTAGIALDAKNVFFWRTRALCHTQIQQFDQAIADWEQLAQLDPAMAQMFAKLEQYARQKRNAQNNGMNDDDNDGDDAAMPTSQADDWPAGRPVHRAVEQFGRNEKKPADAASLIYLTADPEKLRQQSGDAIGRREFAEAVSLLTRAAANADETLRLSVEHDLAWLLAVCPDDTVRDGKRAVELANKVLTARGEPDAGLCDTLAAAYAAQGDLSQAVHWQTKAITLQRRAEQKERYRQRLLLYQAAKPYRLP